MMVFENISLRLYDRLHDTVSLSKEDKNKCIHNIVCGYLEISFFYLILMDCLWNEYINQ